MKEKKNVEEMQDFLNALNRNIEYDDNEFTNDCLDEFDKK